MHWDFRIKLIYHISQVHTTYTHTHTTHTLVHTFLVHTVWDQTIVAFLHLHRFLCRLHQLLLECPFEYKWTWERSEQGPEGSRQQAAHSQCEHIPTTRVCPCPTVRLNCIFCSRTGHKFPLTGLSFIQLFHWGVSGDEEKGREQQQQRLVNRSGGGEGGSYSLAVSDSFVNKYL